MTTAARRGRGRSPTARSRRPSRTRSWRSSGAATLLTRVRLAFNAPLGGEHEPALQAAAGEERAEARRAGGRDLPERQAVHARRGGLRAARVARPRPARRCGWSRTTTSEFVRAGARLSERRQGAAQGAERRGRRRSARSSRTGCWPAPRPARSSSKTAATLAGLPTEDVQAAAQDAKARGLEAQWRGPAAEHDAAAGARLALEPRPCASGSSTPRGPATSTATRTTRGQTVARHRRAARRAREAARLPDATRPGR